MAVRHIVLIELTDDSEGLEFEKAAKEADGLLKAILGVQHYQAGPNTNSNPKRKL